MSRGDDVLRRRDHVPVGIGERECLLAIVGYLSTVFDETTDASSLDLAFEVLEGKTPPKGEIRSWSRNWWRPGSTSRSASST